MTPPEHNSAKSLNGNEPPVGDSSNPEKVFANIIQPPKAELHELLHPGGAAAGKISGTEETDESLVCLPSAILAYHYLTLYPRRLKISY